MSCEQQYFLVILHFSCISHISPPTRAGVEAAALLLAHLGVALSLDARRDVEAVLVLGDAEQAEHLLVDLRRELEAGRQIVARRLGAHDGAHVQEALQCARHDGRVARSEDLGEVRNGDAHLIGFRQVAVCLHAARDWRERRHVPYHRQRAELRMER